MKSLSEIEDTIRDFAYLLFLANAGCSRKQLADFHAHGIPEEWARQFAKEIAALPVEDWPRLIPSPHRKRSLHTDNSKSRVIGNDMTPEHRLAISRRAGKKKDEAFRAHIREHGGFTQNRLAAKIGIKPPLLSMYRRGERACPMERAKAIETLTKWPADARHWPVLLAE